MGGSGPTNGEGAPAGPSGSGGPERGELDAVVVGAGFGGLYLLHRLLRAGFSAVAFETGADVGGTWYWNRYPGARCDVESLEYSYGFDESLQQEWEWTERYAGQPEILRYARHVADRYGLRPWIRFSTTVTAARFDEDDRKWLVETDGGERVAARFLLLATGCLSATNVPSLEAMASFAGPIHHTSRWPEEGVDFGGQRVGVVGTGSSAVQAIPIIARQASELVVFQRTANYVVPARNRPLGADEQAAVKRDYAGFRARNRAMPGAFGAGYRWNTTSVFDVDPDEREEEFEWRYQEGGFVILGAFSDTTLSLEANAFPADFVRRKIHEIVEDPEVADLLTPKQAFGCKRLCLDTGYLETFNLPHVRLVDVSEQPIERLTERGVAVGGRLYELDALVMATGFDAMTGAALRIEVRGRGGRRLQEAWAAGPVTYLGLGVPGFPNLFVVAGPGSPSVLANMFVAIEQHVEWIVDCLEHLRAGGYRTIEADEQAAEAWVAHVNDVASHTLFPTCNSWYLGANIPGKRRVFMPLPNFPPYAERCDEVAAAGYEGFALGH